MSEKHPSEWNKLPVKIKPIIYSTVDAPIPHNYIKPPKFYLTTFLNRFGTSDEVYYDGEWLTMVEFSNGWIWEAGGKGWRLKDGTEHTSECDHDCVHCNDDCGCDCDDCIRLVDAAWSCLDPDESPEPFIIPLREKVYGRDTHAVLMDAHRKRQETKLPDAAHSLIRSLCGDVLTYDGVEEK